MSSSTNFISLYNEWNNTVSNLVVTDTLDLTGVTIIGLVIPVDNVTIQYVSSILSLKPGGISNTYLQANSVQDTNIVSMTATKLLGTVVNNVSNNQTQTLLLLLSNGSAISPSLTFASDQTTGIFYESGDIGFSNGSAVSAFISNEGFQTLVGNIFSNGIFIAGGGIFSNPSYTFETDSTSGLWLSNLHEISLGVDSLQIVKINTTGVTITGSITLSGGLTIGALTCSSINDSGNLSCLAITSTTINCTGITDTGTLSAVGITSTGAINAGLNAISGGVITGTSGNFTSIVDSGTLSCTTINSGTITASGAINSGSNAISGGVITGTSGHFTSIVDSGTLSCTTITSGAITSTGSITGTSGNFTSIVDSGTLSCGAITSSGNFTNGTNTLQSGVIIGLGLVLNEGYVFNNEGNAIDANGSCTLQYSGLFYAIGAFYYGGWYFSDSFGYGGALQLDSSGNWNFLTSQTTSTSGGSAIPSMNTVFKIDQYGNITVYNNITGSGTINIGSHVLTCGPISCTQVTSSGSITATTGNFSSITDSGTLSCTAITCSSVNSSGSITGTSGNFSSIVDSGTLSCTTATTGNINSSGTITASGIVLSDGVISNFSGNCIDSNGPINIVSSNQFYSFGTYYNSGWKYSAGFGYAGAVKFDNSGGWNFMSSQAASASAGSSIASFPVIFYFDKSGNTTISGDVYVPDGLVGTPSYSFINEKTTGFYRVSTNTLGLAIGGTQVAQIGTNYLSSYYTLQAGTATNPISSVDINNSNCPYDYPGVCMKQHNFAILQNAYSQSGTWKCITGTQYSGAYIFSSSGNHDFYQSSSTHSSSATISNFNKNMSITAAGSVVIGNQAALATSATDGFLYVPSCAGTPTGTPTSYTGTVPIVYDSTNNNIWAYNSSWKQYPVQTKSTYTPSFTPGTFTFTNQSGVYYKTGNICQVYIYLSWSAYSSASGTLEVGLPFALAGGLRAVGTISAYSGISYTNQLITSVDSGNSYLVIRDLSKTGGTATTLTNTALGSTGDLSLTICMSTS